MKELLFLFLMSMSFLSCSENRYYSETQIIEGKLSLVQNSLTNPDYKGGLKPVLLLNKPVNIFPKEDDKFNNPKFNVTRIQLVDEYDDDRIEKKVKISKNKTVSLLCLSLMNADYNEDVAEVLCHVKLK